MKEQERPSRPVLFFTEESEFPYWGKGSSFFVASDQHVYWVTARHVMENQGASPYDLLITPSDDSAISVPFVERLQIENDPDNEDFRDICMLRVNIEEFLESTDSELYAWNINRDFYDCTNLSTGDELFLLGFPSESRFVDYDVKRIHFTKVVLRGVYQEQSSDEHCHKLRLETSITLDELDGLSGGAVFRYPSDPNEPAKLVGLVIRGTSGSGIIHFIDSAILGEFVRKSEAI